MTSAKKEARKHYNRQLLPRQLKPFPVKPVLQVHLKDANVFWQMALTSQTGTKALHSSASEKINPKTASENTNQEVYFI